jgi:hypothetical protein
MEGGGSGGQAQKWKRKSMLTPELDRRWRCPLTIGKGINPCHHWQYHHSFRYVLGQANWSQGFIWLNQDELFLSFFTASNIISVP